MTDTTTPIETTQPERTPIDANALEAMARERPDEMILKGSGVLKLTGAIRQLEGELRTLRMADPAAGISRELLGKIIDEAFGGSIEDTTSIEDIYRIIVRDVPRRITPNLENLQDRLLAPTPIERDDIGHWYHPHLPDCDEVVSYSELLAVFGLEVACVDMEGDATKEVAEQYFDKGEPDCSAWQPSTPAGDGWSLLAIYDTEDGPHAMFARRTPPEQFARNHISPRRWAQRLVKFLNAAAGEGLVLDSIDAADLYTEVLPKTYLHALREAEDATAFKPMQPPGFIKPDTHSTVYFYEQDFYVLSNFSAFTLLWHGQRFDTSEAAYHFEKFKHGEGSARVRAAIMNAPSAHQAFKVAERNKDLRRPDWEQVKVQIMRSILRAKAEQHEYVRRKLLATGDRELVEDSWRDAFWGWGPDRDGQNMLGKLWMEIRAELRDTITATPHAEEGGAQC